MGAFISVKGEQKNLINDIKIRNLHMPINIYDVKDIGKKIRIIFTIKPDIVVNENDKENIKDIVEKEIADKYLDLDSLMISKNGISIFLSDNKDKFNNITSIPMVVNILNRLNKYFIAKNKKEIVEINIKYKIFGTMTLLEIFINNETNIKNLNKYEDLIKIIKEKLSNLSFTNVDISKLNFMSNILVENTSILNLFEKINMDHYELKINLDT